jgi:hypothetical protein
MSSYEMSFMTNMFGNGPECPFKNILGWNVPQLSSFHDVYTERTKNGGHFW